MLLSFGFGSFWSDVVLDWVPHSRLKSKEGHLIGTTDGKSHVDTFAMIREHVYNSSANLATCRHVASRFAKLVSEA